jgi:hypothetical protein
VPHDQVGAVHIAEQASKLAYWAFALVQFAWTAVQ